MRKLMKWEEMQEEGGWKIARSRRAGGLREALVRRWTLDVRAIAKWEEMQEEGRWAIARERRAGG